MNTRLAISLALFLLGCPTPPESGVGGGAGSPGPGPDGGGGTAATPGGAIDNPLDPNPDEKAGTFTVNELPPEIANAPSDGDQPSSSQAQAAIKDGDHVTFSGEIICADCSGQLVLKVAQFVTPDPLDSSTEAPRNNPVADDFQMAPYIVSKAGSFVMAVPKYNGQVVIEVLDDVDGNGRPSRGEKFTVLHNHGKISANKNQSGLNVDFSKLPSTGGTGGPAGGPPPGDGPPPVPQ